jgi:flagellar motility protein MotE (MotC chaperone)
MKLPSYVRLLPSVVVVGTALLVLKTSGLVHEAYAEAGGQQSAPLTNDPVPANADYAGGADDEIASASEVDVVNALAKRRKELDARQTTLNTQANMIAAAEQRVDAKIAQLKQLQTQINGLLVQRDDAQKAQIAALVKTYSTMKAVDAARIFNNLPDEVLLPVAQSMKSDALALVMAKMSPDAAQKLTVRLADRLTLPPAIAPLTVPAAPVTGTAPAAPTQAAAAQSAPAAPAAPQSAEKPKT